MSGEKKKGITKRLTQVMVVIGIGAAACGAVAIFSILYLKSHIDNVIAQTYTGMGLALVDVSKSAVIFCIIIVIVIVCTAIFSILYIYRISKRIQAPVDMVENVVRAVASTGSLNIPSEMDIALNEYTDAENDEISSLILSLRKMIDGLVQKVEVLRKVAEGDLRHKVIPASDVDTLSIAVNDVVENISSIVRDVVRATDQLSTGANELSLGAQTLSQSASEQSATMDQLHVTAAEIAAEAEENASRAFEASKVTNSIRSSASEGSSKMLEMNEAMKEINKASHAIGSVMKAIDEIAFQTNILALNAAVEAARAGVHGKGFAVVADEVRNLATKSGSAANDSNALIADTIVKSDTGNKIVEEAIEFFRTIEDSISSTSELLDEIAKAAKKQSEAIDHINQGVTDMTNVVYHNSATSEQSAAASQEMSSQALLLKETIKRFQIEGVTVFSSETAHIESLHSPPPFAREKEPLVIESVEVEPRVFEPAPAPALQTTFNPTTDSLAGDGRTPAEIYAEALGREAPGSVPTQHSDDSAGSQGFTDDISKY